MPNPSDFLGNSQMSTTLVGPFTTTGPATLLLRIVDTRRIGICIIPLFGFAPAGESALVAAKVINPSILSRTFDGVNNQTTFTWGTTLFDNDSMAGNAGTTGVLTVQTPGIYFVNGNVAGDPAFLPNQSELDIRQNGVAFESVTDYNNLANGGIIGGFGSHVCGIAKAVAGDTFDLHTEDGKGNHAAPSALGGSLAAFMLPTSTSGSSPGFAFPVSQGTAPNIPPSSLSQSADPFSNIWINWPQYAPLPTYSWYYWVPAAGTYNFLIEELFLVRDPCQRAPDTNTLPIPITGTDWQGTDGSVSTTGTSEFQGDDNSPPPTIFQPPYTPGG